MPPPNVTGKLHIGHALTFTIQDMLIRHNRMKGLDAKWQAGIDHAGIATQMVTEREMLKQGIKKDDLSKQQFIEKIWEQKEKSQKEIFSQFGMLGLCCDFDNAVFTMDDIPKTAVKKAFIELYNDGLIYKSKRLINFDISLKTAISDLEVINKEIKSKFFYINYLFKYFLIVI